MKGVRRGMLSYQNFIYLVGIYFGLLFLTTSYERFIKLFCETCLYWLDFKINISKEEIEKLPSKLIVVTSHTSVYDFLFSFIFYQMYLRQKYNAQILMKESFESYVSPILKYVDNRFNIIRVSGGSGNLVQQITDQLKHQNNWVLGIAPEGTRKCVPKLKSGYYYLSKNLESNILYIGIDYEKKTVQLEPLHSPLSNWKDEEEWFISICRKYQPLFPDQCYWTREEYLEIDYLQPPPDSQVSSSSSS